MRLKVFDLETEVDGCVAHADIERAERAPQPLRNRDVQSITGPQRTGSGLNQIARHADVVRIEGGRERLALLP
ncbi:MAG: hypothetical protein WDM85_17425 [Caulobacteraceae bacterium]